MQELVILHVLLCAVLYQHGNQYKGLYLAKNIVLETIRLNMLRESYVLRLVNHHNFANIFRLFYSYVPLILLIMILDLFISLFLIERFNYSLKMTKNLLI